MLCRQCHGEKTVEQGRHSKLTSSTLSDELWSELVDGPAPGALVFEAQKPPPGGLKCFDREKCRSNILMSSMSDWPVFLPCDGIEEYRGEEAVGDWCWVRVPAPVVKHKQEWTAKALLASLPMRGSGWYTGDTVRYSLAHGLIRRSQITHVVRASCRISSADVGAAWRRVLGALPEKTSLEGRLEKLRKTAANSAVGLMGRRRQARYECVTSTSAQDLLMHAKGRETFASRVNEEWTDFVSVHERATRQTYLWYRMILDQEALILSQLIPVLAVESSRVPVEYGRDPVRRALRPSGAGQPLEAGGTCRSARTRRPRPCPGGRTSSARRPSSTCWPAAACTCRRWRAAVTLFC